MKTLEIVPPSLSISPFVSPGSSNLYGRVESPGRLCSNLLVTFLDSLWSLGAVKLPTIDGLQFPAARIPDLAEIRTAMTWGEPIWADPKK